MIVIWIIYFAKFYTIQYIFYIDSYIKSYINIYIINDI